MKRPLKHVVYRVATAVAILLAGGVALFALRLLVVGVPLTVVPEVPVGSEQLARVVDMEYAPYPFAIVPFIAMILFVGGLLTQKLWIGWVGWVILVVFSALFLFSSGAAVLPAAGVLFVLLVIISYGQSVRGNGLRTVLRLL
jgi:hypothetical protein